MSPRWRPRGCLRILYLPLLDLSVDEALQSISDAVSELGATRVVIDSLSGFEVALAPGFREEFRESLYRLSRESRYPGNSPPGSSIRGCRTRRLRC